MYSDVNSGRVGRNGARAGHARNGRCIRVLGVDDHELLVRGIAARLEIERDIEWVGHLDRADDLVETVRRDQPDVVLLDIGMEGTDPFEAADVVQREFPEIRLIILSAFVRDHYVDRAVHAGACGYFSKSDDPGDLVDGIRRVSRGEYAFGPRVVQRIGIDPRRNGAEPAEEPAGSRLDTLTKRERQVLCLIGEGLSRAEIADMLHRSRKTIDVHSTNIMRKLDIHDRVELSRFAIREGLIEA